jgi:hypothetical protein
MSMLSRFVQMLDLEEVDNGTSDQQHQNGESIITSGDLLPHQPTYRNELTPPVIKDDDEINTLDDNDNNGTTNTMKPAVMSKIANLLKLEEYEEENDDVHVTSRDELNHHENEVNNSSLTNNNNNITQNNESNTTTRLTTLTPPLVQTMDENLATTNVAAEIPQTTPTITNNQNLVDVSLDSSPEPSPTMKSTELLPTQISNIVLPEMLSPTILPPTKPIHNNNTTTTTTINPSRTPKVVSFDMDDSPIRTTPLPPSSTQSIPFNLQQQLSITTTTITTPTLNPLKPPIRTSDSNNNNIPQIILEQQPNNILSLKFPESFIHDLSQSEAPWTTDEYDSVVLDGVLEKLNNPPTPLVNQQVMNDESSSSTTTTTVIESHQKEKQQLLQRIELLESELTLRRAEAAMLRSGVMLSTSTPSPQHQKKLTSTPSTPSSTTKPSSQTFFQTPSSSTSSKRSTSSITNNEDVLKHCASIVKRLGGSTDSTTSTLHYIRSLGEKLTVLSAKLAQSESKIEELKLEKIALRNMIITYIERGGRKDALRVLASALEFSPEERLRVGLIDHKQSTNAWTRATGTSNNTNNTNKGSFLDTLNDFVRDEIS